MSEQNPLDHDSSADSPAAKQSSEFDIPMKPDGESPFGPSPQPRLGIIHIMLWTLGSAMILAIYRALAEFGSMPVEARAMWYVMQTGYSVVYGAALASVILFGYRRVTKGAPFPVLPGHWLLLIQGVVFTIGFAGHMAMWVAQQWVDNFIPAMYGLAQWLANGVAVLLLVAAILRLDDFSYWRRYFWASLVLHAIRATAGMMGTTWRTWLVAFSLQRWLYGLGAIVLAIWLLVVVVRDWRRGARRDWLHWTGVVVTLSGPVLFAVQMLWSILLDRGF